MLFDLLRGLLVDEGKTLAQITAIVSSELALRSLLTREIANRLGGDWDLTKTGAPIGRYWQSLYLLRNRVVHAAYEPNVTEAEEASDAYLKLREFVNVRLWQKHRKYPRTLLVKVGVNGLERRGWLTKRMSKLCEEYFAEPLPFYWPKDSAHRPA